MSSFAFLASWREIILGRNEIVDAAYRVHTTLGPGLLESVYEAALAYELEKRGLRITRQQAIPVVYHTGFHADLVVEDAVDPESHEAFLGHPFIEQGLGVERVQDWIGHANIQSTMEYAKVTDARRAIWRSCLGRRGGERPLSRRPIDNAGHVRLSKTDVTYRVIWPRGD